MDMLTQRLLMTLMQGAQPQQAFGGHPQHHGNRLMTALARGKGDAKYARLAALPKYGEQRNTAGFGNLPGVSSDAALGAYQDDAFQNDAFQT